VHWTVGILPHFRALRRWLEAKPNDEFAKDVRAKPTSEPERFAAYTREYLACARTIPRFGLMKTGLPPAS
jgi:hypothetical protein